MSTAQTVQSFAGIANEYEFYCPDFLVHTADAVYLVETKGTRQDLNGYKETVGNFSVSPDFRLKADAPPTA